MFVFMLVYSIAKMYRILSIFITRDAFMHFL